MWSTSLALWGTAALACFSGVTFASDGSDTSHLLYKRQTGTNIVGAQNANGVQERLPIQRMMTETPDAFNMFLYALSTMQRSVAETNSLSYYQISGIHGRPFIPWQEPVDGGMDFSRGYCTHGSALFPTWHRPYIALMEQRIVAHAINLANRFAEGTQRTRWLNAARRVRHPYWDWAAPDLRSSIPLFVRTPRVRITQAGTGGQPVSVEIPNPLYQYAFRDRDLQNRYFSGIYRTVAATRRYPTSDFTASQNNIADQVMRNSYESRRQNTFNLFSIPNFNAFGNTAYRDPTSPISWTSVEGVHNDIHVNCGGNGGHLSLIDYSSFDPLFWLHHCNVDRLVAMYQAIHPTRTLQRQQAVGTFARRVGSGDVDDINTPLRPFRNGAGNYFTSSQLSSAGSIWNLNYAYPEVPVRFRGRPASELSAWATSAVNNLYSRQAASMKVKRQANRRSREWICHILFNPTEIPGDTGSPECLVFLGQPSDDVNERKVEPNYIGSAASLIRQNTDEVANMNITATVPLTDALEAAGVDVNDVVATVTYLKENLLWTIQKGDTKIPAEEVRSLVVGVSSANVTYGSSSDLPTWGQFETYFETTQDKFGGMEPVQEDIVVSIPVAHAISDEDPVPPAEKVGVDTNGTAARMASGYRHDAGLHLGYGKHSEYDSPAEHHTDSKSQKLQSSQDESCS